MTNEDSDKASRMARAMREGVSAITEKPGIVTSSLGTVILAMIRNGDPISEEALISELEAIAAGTSRDHGLSSESAKGALNFISRLRD